MNRILPCLVLGFSVQNIFPQGELYVSMWFDTGSGLQLDSVYPNQTWQVGQPDKIVFDSAYSAPNALVTDTIAPYPVNGVDYAEFHLPLEDLVSVAEIYFRQRMDAAPSEGWGWLEFHDPYTHQWLRLLDNDSQWSFGEGSYTGAAGTVTDSGVVFTGGPTGWTEEYFNLSCFAVFWNEGDRGGDIDTTLRFRFAFESLANTDSRDGWMIDNVHLHLGGPCNGIKEHAFLSLMVYPNPVDGNLMVENELPSSGKCRIEIVRSDGALVKREERTVTRTLMVRTSELVEGTYALRLFEGERQTFAPFVVKH